MPRITAFHGIVIYMYWGEDPRHLPHFHAFLGNEEASISLEREILDGALGRRTLQLVIGWVALDRGELRQSGSARARAKLCCHPTLD